MDFAFKIIIYTLKNSTITKCSIKLLETNAIIKVGIQLNQNANYCLQAGGCDVNHRKNMLLADLQYFRKCLLLLLWLSRFTMGNYA
jgi:hypothetical protein